MLKKKFAITACSIVFLVAFFSCSAHGGTYESGNSLLELLTAEPGSAELALAYGYVIGVTDAYRNDLKQENPFCPPPLVTKQQVVDIVTSWLKSNPTLRHYTAPSIVAGALSLSFPCGEYAK